MPPRTPDTAPESAAARQPSATIAVARSVGRESMAVDFASSVIAGFLIGLTIDWLAGTRPWFIVAGITAGCLAGFVKLWTASKVLEDQAVERIERRRG